MTNYRKFTSRLIRAFGVILGAALLFANSGEARTTRGCQLELYFHVEHAGRDLDELAEDDPRYMKRLSAGSLTFRASAPGVSHNLARMRASRKAEACLDNFWNGEHCRSRAAGSSYGESYDATLSIVPLMEQAICADLYAIATGTDNSVSAESARALIGEPMMGQLRGVIDGDRCCKNSYRECTYAYGDNRYRPRIIQRFEPRGRGGPRGEVIWPGASWGTMCPHRILETIPFPQD